MGGLEVEPSHVALERAICAASGPETKAVADLLVARRHVDRVDELLICP